MKSWLLKMDYQIETHLPHNPQNQPSWEWWKNSRFLPSRSIPPLTWKRGEGWASAPAAPTTGIKPCKSTGPFSVSGEEKGHTTNLFALQCLHVRMCCELQLQVSFLPLKYLCGSGPATDVWPGLQRMNPAHLSIQDTGGSRTDHIRCRRPGRPLSWEQHYQSLNISA